LSELRYRVLETERGGPGSVVSAAVLSIGSNVGDRIGYLRGCVALLGDAVRMVSPVYATAPWGGVEQDEFLNAILLVEDPNADALEWLRRAQRCEAAAQRTRDIRWGPRTLDVDVIDVDQTRRDDPQLTLPHPRAHQRAFVLVPWLDMQPSAVLAGHGPVAGLVAALPPAEKRGVRRRDELELRSP
ncbi:MAG: 2-amino-4-hydroxy-6-hydroxymethyldihydropteridine diphosphokinase, partial [Pseudonocardiaceae bacterium]